MRRSGRPEMVEMAISHLVLDFELYPRHDVDATNVREMVHALEAGIELPPILVDRASKRVVDGFHRVYAARRRGGDEATIRAELRDYADDAAIFAEAMWINARHGRRLTPWDRARCILLARKLGVSDEETAARLQITRERLAEFAMERTATAPNGDLIPLKFSSVPSLSGRTLTAEQVEANEHAGGMRAGYYASKLYLALESGLVDWEDNRLVARLEQIYRFLGEHLPLRQEDVT